jgi:hypothetical protein
VSLTTALLYLLAAVSLCLAALAVLVGAERLSGLVLRSRGGHQNHDAFKKALSESRLDTDEDPGWSAAGRREREALRAILTRTGIPLADLLADPWLRAEFIRIEAATRTDRR